jgi:Cu(I)/Ag(I) efflux system membrane protein CusA/SilA
MVLDQLIKALTNADVEAAAIEGAAQRLRPKLMTVCAVLASLIPILCESGIGSDVMKTDRRAYCGRHDYFHHPRPNLVPVFFVMMEERALRQANRK